ncbi:hypothetical protein H2204_013419 [Knufia peltigerae]|uniref:AB hydrolase-1 domain-containing protein n=1 Tax=Knufia peltigerae TaxID=1002370 RepID=A0AA39CQ48_9EURO|nr:hypothetical protein H2204_013419 [Knufia peltigerae]
MQVVKISPTLSINYTIHKWDPGSLETKAGPEDLGIWVILISGLGDTQVIWEDQIKAFIKAGYSVLTYDNRGVGLSSRPATEDDVKWTAEDMASDLRAVVKTLGLPRYHILGISMGGMIAQSYASMYGNHSPISQKQGGGIEDDDVDDDDDDRVRPDELMSLTLACTYADPGPFCTRMFSLWRDMATKMSVADACREVLLWCFTPEWFSDPKQQGFLATVEGMMNDADEEMGLPAYLAQLNVIMTFDSRGWVGRLGAAATNTQEAATDVHPTSVFVLVGEKDGLIPHCQSKELCDLIDGAEWVVTKGAHACNNEYPDEFSGNAMACFKKAEERFWP